MKNKTKGMMIGLTGFALIAIQLIFLPIEKVFELRMVGGPMVMILLFPLYVGIGLVAVSLFGKFVEEKK